MSTTLGGFQTVTGKQNPLKNAGAPTNGVDEVQRLTSTASGGSFKATFINPLTLVSKQTAAIAWDATLAAIIAALEALSNFPVGGAVAAGGPTLDAAFVTLSFAGEFSGVNVAPLVIDNTLATGGTVVASTDTAGVAGTGKGTPKGDLLADTTNDDLYQNTGTNLKPVWAKVGTQT